MCLIGVIANSENDILTHMDALKSMAVEICGNGESLCILASYIGSGGKRKRVRACLRHIIYEVIPITDLLKTGIKTVRI